MRARRGYPILRNRFATQPTSWPSIRRHRARSGERLPTCTIFPTVTSSTGDIIGSSPAAGWESAKISPFLGIPFRNIQRVSFDEADESAIYVNTFGGSIWKGPADE